MSLKEIHEQQRSPIEQLQELNRQSRVEMENSLLKEALALSSEQCEKSLQECVSLLQMAEQKWQSEQQRSNAWHEQQVKDLRIQVEKLQSSNAILQREISGKIGDLTDKVRRETVKEIERALQGQVDTIQKKTKAFEQQGNKLQQEMERQVERVEHSQKRFFAFNTWQMWVFWSGWICSILTLAILLFMVFAK